MILFSLILIPLLFAALLALAPAAQARSMAFVGMLTSSAAAVLALLRFDWSNGAAFANEKTFGWLSELGIQLSVGADSVSMLMIALTALLGPICVAASATAVTERHRTFFGWLLVLQAAMYGVFVARDLILFYICFEFTLVPMFVLISVFGSTNRKHASVKFFLYTFAGSVIALAGLVYVAKFNAQLPVNASRESLAAMMQAGGTAAPGPGVWTFDIETLARAARRMSSSEQAWVLLALMAGFAVKVPLFPVHTWLPLAHTEAPTAGSVILAGVLLKLGTYGIFRFAIPFVPAAFAEYAPLIAQLCIVGILYGGLICWVQTDVKKLVAYSSVAHLGFCVLGLAATNTTGLSGSILYMINHGLSTGALFLCIGMVYERYHTRSMKELGGLAAKMPVWSTFMVFFTMASVGLPGLNGFVSEFMCLLAAFQSSSAWGSSTTMVNGAMDAGLWGSAGASTVGATHGGLGPWYAAIAGIGMIVAAMYLLLMVGRVVWGPLVEPHGHGGHGHDAHAAHGTHGANPHDHHQDHHHDHHVDHHGPLPADLTTREITVLAPLAILCVVLGVYPKPLLSALEGPVNQTVELIDSARAMGLQLDAPAHSTPPATPPATSPAHGGTPTKGHAQ